MDKGFELLRIRRIDPQTIITFNIQLNGRGWVYPIPGGGQRWKAYDSNAHPKYRWVPVKPPSARLYHAPGVHNAILSAGGICWYVSGEADVWAMHSARVRHVLSAFGESYVITDLVDTLRALGVRLVRLAPDLDDSGTKWSRKVAYILKESDIRLDAFQLPGSLGPKGDLGKAWQEYQGNVPFEHWLLSLPSLEITPEENHPHKLVPDKTLGEPVPAGYRELVIKALGVGRFKSDGNSRDNILCPFHKDKVPSATLHREKGLFCHDCGEHYLWQEVGIKKGLGTIKEWRLSQHPSTPCQLSTETREALIRSKLTNIARVYDAFFLAGWKPGKEFTIKEAAAVCEPFGISVKTLYKITNRNNKSISPFLPTTMGLIKKEVILGKLNCRGRRFRLLSPREIDVLVGMDENQWKHYDAITPEALGNVAAYRADVHGAMIRRRPGTYPRSFLAGRLGVRPKTTRTYDVLADLEVIPDFRRKMITEDDAAEFPEERKEMPGNVWLETDGKKFAPTKSGAARAFQEGSTVYMVEQLANYYRLKDEETT
jgi:hypothetical protein